MRKMLSRILALALAVSTLTVGHGFAAEKLDKKKEKVLYQTAMKSEKELRKDALEGKRDRSLKNLKIEMKDEKGNTVKELTNYTYYTVQKLKETQVDGQVSTDYVVYAVTDPSGYDQKDSDPNPGVNFRQTVWMWTSIIQENGVDRWGKATRYEARWDLLDGTQLTIKSGEFNAKAYGKKQDGTVLNVSDPKTYYPPTWGQSYVKTPSWTYVRIDDQFGGFGARLKTPYTARSSTGTLYSVVSIGSITL